MLPDVTRTDMADGRGVDTQDVGQGLVAQVALPNPHHIGLGEFGPRALVAHGYEATLKSFTPVGDGISEVQAIRVAADRSIAPVQNIKVVGGAVVDAVRGYVGSNDVQLAVDSHAELPVAPTAERCWPIPAALSWRAPWHEPAEGLFFGEALGSPESFSGQWIAVASPAVVVGTTETIGMDRLRTIWDRADHLPSIRGRSLSLD
jgi:hypothetical protein